MSEALALVDVTVSYKSGTALRGISLSVAAGEALGLVGESGSGKTTVAFAVMRALPAGTAFAGQIRVHGRNLWGLDAAALRQLRARHVSMVYQDPVRALSPTLTVGTQIGEAYRLLGMARRAAREAAFAMLGRVRIANPAAVMRQYPHQLSGGMAQRVVIAMALAKRPALLVMDEPTTGLDAASAGSVMEIVDQLRQESGTALLLISHDLALVTRTCGRVGVMHNGMIVEQGEVAAVLRAPRHDYTRALIAAVPHGKAPAPPLGDEILTVCRLSKSSPFTPRLRGIEFSVAAGETLGLTGPSGGGKTTLARIVLGLEQGDPGVSLRLAGEELPPRLRNRTRQQRRALQAVFQNPDAALNRALTVRRILLRAVTILAGERGAAREARVLALMRQVRLDAALLDRRPRELSGGQKQRVAIAHAFAGTPKVVICDEFTSALDLSVQKTVLDLMVELRATQRVATVLISHDLAVMEYLADRVLEI